MTSNLSRREFLRRGALAATLFGFGGLNELGAGAGLNRAMGAESPEKRWFKGNMHMHNQWSDGEPTPEWAVHWYKSHGYNFICPSDHNIFQSNELRFKSHKSNPKLTDAERAEFDGETSLWKPISSDACPNKLTEKVLAESRAIFGDDSIRVKKVGAFTFVRMKPFDELVEQFAAPGEFLMLPGYEQTGSCADGRALHMNFIGVRKTFPYIKKDEPVDGLRETFAKGRDLYGAEPYLFTANHPMWRFYDYSPSALIESPFVRFFELTNNGIAKGMKADANAWKPEKFWDVVNAFRAVRDQQLLFGTGSDDRHDYTTTPKGWTLVRAAELSQNSLFEAMNVGDMYASNGLDFAELEFDGKTLAVKIAVKEEGAYRIEFIGTKKNFDQTRSTFEAVESETKTKRIVENYSDEIGVVLETVEGTEGSYTLKSDDLYVRAKIVKISAGLQPEWKSKPAAWSQPYRA